MSSVTDGSTTVSPATALDFTAGATVTDGGNGVAEVAVAGGSLPLGRPKADDGTTYTGIPGSPWGLNWHELPMADGMLYMVPLRVEEAIVVSELEIVIASAPLTNQGVRAAISAADEDWQPDGNVIYQGTGTVPSTASEFDTVDITGLSVALSPGLHLVALEMEALDGGTFYGRPALCPASVFCTSSNPGEILVGFPAPHVYGPFAAGLPRWDSGDVLTNPGTTLSGGANTIHYPFVMKWEPA